MRVGRLARASRAYTSRMRTAVVLALVLAGGCKQERSKPAIDPDAPPTCVGGLASKCSGGGMKWTGTECCVPAPATCVSGTGFKCSGNGMRWTGAHCCVEGPTTCTTGQEARCSGAGMAWTGALCCVSAR